jgi:hypothetical protein
MSGTGKGLDRVELDKQVSAVLYALLDAAADAFGDNVCGDFDLADFMPDANARRELVLAYHEVNGDPEEFEPKCDYDTVEDFVLMRFFANWFKRRAGL